MNNTYVISLGGSLIVPPAGINENFLKKFRDLILKRVEAGDKFYIICGGGTTCRNYQNAARKITNLNNNELDWLGIHACRLNANFLRILFQKEVCSEIILNFENKISAKENIIIAGGSKPGHSSDHAAVEIAEKVGAQTVINLSNIDYVYDCDPQKNKNAKKIEQINWIDFRKIVGDQWVPGSGAPFDPIASQKAQALKLKVVIMNGTNLDSLNKYFIGDKFAGTVIG
jgi:uridylate kinase